MTLLEGIGFAAVSLAIWLAILTAAGIVKWTITYNGKTYGQKD